MLVMAASERISFLNCIFTSSTDPNIKFKHKEQFTAPLEVTAELLKKSLTYGDKIKSSDVCNHIPTASELR